MTVWATTWIDLTIPGRVWGDCLDPAATDMQAALGLPAPTHRRRGRGWSAIYLNVPTDAARELAEYMRDRADTLGPDDPENSSLYSAMRQTAKRIMAEIDAHGSTGTFAKLLGTETTTTGGDDGDE